VCPRLPQRDVYGAVSRNATCFLNPFPPYGIERHQSTVFRFSLPGVCLDGAKPTRKLNAAIFGRIGLRARSRRTRSMTMSHGRQAYDDPACDATSCAKTITGRGSSISVLQRARLACFAMPTPACYHDAALLSFRVQASLIVQTYIDRDPWPRDQIPTGDDKGRRSRLCGVVRLENRGHGGRFCCARLGIAPRTS
jgi:hypothetical protein